MEKVVFVLVLFLCGTMYFQEEALIFCFCFHFVTMSKVQCSKAMSRIKQLSSPILLQSAKFGTKTLQLLLAVGDESPGPLRDQPVPDDAQPQGCVCSCTVFYRTVYFHGKALPVCFYWLYVTMTKGRHK